MQNTVILIIHIISGGRDITKSNGATIPIPISTETHISYIRYHGSVREAQLPLTQNSVMEIETQRSQIKRFIELAPGRH